MKLILGSKSPWRKHILEDAGYTFTVLVADIDEKAIRSNDFIELPLLIALAKADALLPKINEDAILITSDQVIVCNGQLREKPESKEQAKVYLQSYGTYPAQTNTAVVVTNTKNGKQATGVDIATAYFKEIPPPTIDELIKEGNIMDAAGALITEHPLLEKYIDHLDGTIDSISGLPLELTKKLIKEVE